MEKEKDYERLALQLQALLENETNLIANLANTAALLYHSLEDINWTGFYLFQDDELILGPFQGKPACMHIAKDKGVCGSAFSKRCVVRVSNVHEFPGHIACDSASKSEIVLPIYQKETCIGVLDIDAPIYDRFDETDECGLQKIVAILQDTLKA